MCGSDPALARSFPGCWLCEPVWDLGNAENADLEAQSTTRIERGNVEDCNMYGLITSGKIDPEQ